MANKKKFRTSVAWYVFTAVEIILFAVFILMLYRGDII